MWAGQVGQGGGLVGQGGRLRLWAGRGRVGGGQGGAGWGDGVAGRMGWLGRVGWYGPAAVNVYTARKGVCNCGVKSVLQALYNRVVRKNLGGL